MFSWQLLRDKGRPNHRTYYSKVEQGGGRRAEFAVRFDLSGSQRSRIAADPRPDAGAAASTRSIRDSFEETTFEPPVGSGPYVVERGEAGRERHLRAQSGLLGRDLPINRGFWNFDEIRFDFYRDANSYFEAFKKGLYDVRAEHDPSRWQTGYDGPALRSGKIVKESFPTGMPKILSAFVFNTRRPIFADIRVREAIGLLFDFGMGQQEFLLRPLPRNASYFDGFGAVVRRAARRCDRARAARRVSRRGARRRAGRQMGAAGDRRLGPRPRHPEEGARRCSRRRASIWSGPSCATAGPASPFTFEILATTREQERLALAFARDLKRAGIAANLRAVDAVQFDRRKLTYDYDMIENRWDQSLSPGNEQAFYWGSAAADTDGTRNYMGVRSRAIDAVIAALLQARERDEFVSAVRALDRILISGFYVVPLFHLPDQWVARSNAIEHPATTPLFGYLPETWWRAQ